MKTVTCPCCKNPSMFVQRKDETLKFFIDTILIDIEWYCPTCNTTFTATSQYILNKTLT